jgi:hypothetical protein
MLVSESVERVKGGISGCSVLHDLIEKLCSEVEHRAC